MNDTLGNVILEKEKFLLASGNEISISLAPLSYILKEIIVLDALNNTIYFAPLKNTELVGYTNTPLPVAFAVAPDATTNVSLDVITVNTESLGIMEAMTFDETQCNGCITDRNGILNHAFEFTGSNWIDYDVRIFSEKIGSVSFWLSMTDNSTYQPLFFYGYNYSTPVPDLYKLYFENEKLSGFTPWFNITSTKIDDLNGAWRHVVIRWNYDQRTGSLFIDGKEVVSAFEYTSRVTGVMTVQHIGKDYIRDYVNHFGKPTVPRYGKFKFDDFSTYKRYLNDEEIKRLSTK